MGITANQKWLLNHRMGKIAGSVLLGDLIENAENNTIDPKTYVDFTEKDTPLFSVLNGGAASGTDTATNTMFINGTYFEYYFGGGNNDTAVPSMSATGLNIAHEDDALSVEYTNGNASTSKHAYVCGTDRFYMEAQISVVDVSEHDRLMVGFRKVMAYGTAVDDYDDMVALDMDNGDLKIESIIGDAATSITDTTSDLADGEYFKVRIEYDHEVGLASAIALANETKDMYLAHIADTAMHTTAADTVNTLQLNSATVGYAYNIGSLITLISEMLTDYDAHEGDSEGGGAGAYHAGAETDEDSLTSAVAPTDLPECITKLNDLKLKLLSHEADASSHAVQTQRAISSPYASSSTITYGIDTQTLTAPPTDAAFTFDDAEVVIPFLYQIHKAGVAADDLTYLVSWEVGELT